MLIYPLTIILNFIFFFIFILDTSIYDFFITCILILKNTIILLFLFRNISLLLSLWFHHNEVSIWNNRLVFDGCNRLKLFLIYIVLVVAFYQMRNVWYSSFDVLCHYINGSQMIGLWHQEHFTLLLKPIFFNYWI